MTADCGLRSDLPRWRAPFRARGWEVWVLGGPKEQAMVEVIAAAAPIRDFTRTPLEDAVSPTGQRHLFLGNDSGMLHIAGRAWRPQHRPVRAHRPGSDRAAQSLRHRLAPPPGQIDLREISAAAVICALDGLKGHLDVAQPA